MEIKITVCKHVKSGERKPDFLLGHRGRTMAAFCYECEAKFHEADIAAELPPDSNPIEAIEEPTSLSFEEAFALGIPEQVGCFADEACIYG